MSETSLKGNRTRAEEVRARRQQSSQVRQSQASQQVRKPVRTTPHVVTRRNVASPAPAYQRARSKTRRSFSISMDGGAELVLGSLPNIQIGWRTVSGIVAAILVLILLGFTNSSMFRVTTPELVGITRTNIQDIASVVNLNNKPIYSVDPQIVAAQVTQSFPQLTNVRVSVSLPATVVISAEERQPVLAWEYNGPIVWIDAEGHIFEPSGEISGIPTVHADNLPPYTEVKPELESNSLVTASPLAPTVRQMDVALLQAAIQIAGSIPAGSDLIYNPLEGFGWNDVGGWRVYIGTDLSNLELKLIVYQAINQTLIERGITPAMISVAQPDAPFYRVE